MNLSSPDGRILAVDPSASLAAARDRATRAFLLTFAFLAFFPYPAVSVGNNTGIQLSEMMAMAVAPLLLLAVPSRTTLAFVCLAAPRILSAFVATLKGDAPEPAVIHKELLSTLIAISILLPSAWATRREMIPRLIPVAAAAILIHVLLGMNQYYWYTKEQFPLLFLYKNPSFKPMEDWADIHARYIQRPFGLFPEPSAMSASIGPWLLLFAGVLVDFRLADQFGISRRVRKLMGVTLLGGFALMAVSRSGSVPFVVAGVVAIVLRQAYVMRHSLNPTVVAAGLAIVAAAAGAVGFVVLQIQSGLDARIETSWGLRSMSIVAALTPSSAPTAFLFGVGPGQSTETVRKMLAHVPLAVGADELAVWSVSAGYYMETGLMGALGIGLVFLRVVRSIKASSARLLGTIALALWAVGVTLTTSYTHLPAIWLFLGLLIEWDRVFPMLPARPESV